ncbi:hypothetical protein F9003_23925 [Bacteroides fragilis]|nr:hypothetical protein F9003_23925 [Bacteroides fragilis]
MGKPTDLQMEMKGWLPSKLKNITFSGSSFTSLNDDILKGMRSPFIHISLFNTSLSAFPNNFFKNMGRVRNISLDIRHNNMMLKQVPNPNTGMVPYLPHSVFLTDLKMSGNNMNCDCSLGWVEFWQRKRRQYICSSQTWTDTVFRTFMNAPCQIYGRHDCEEMDDDLRETKCANKNSQQLMEVLKSDLECGWDAGSRIELAMSVAIVSVLMLFWI